MLVPQESFSKYVSSHICSGDVDNCYFVSFACGSNIMVTDIDMLRSSIKLRVIRELNLSLVVGIDNLRHSGSCRNFREDSATWLLGIQRLPLLAKLIEMISCNIERSRSDHP